MDLQIFKGRWGEKKEGEESGIHNNPPQTGILCMCVCLRADMYVYVCVFL